MSLLALPRGIRGRYTSNWLFVLVGFGLVWSGRAVWADTRVDYTPVAQANQCLVDAVGFQTTLQVQYPGTWSRILKITWNSRTGPYRAHAYCIYEIGGRLYAYDSRDGQRALDLPCSAKRCPDRLGEYLGRERYGSAQYLRAFDPVSLASLAAVN